MDALLVALAAAAAASLPALLLPKETTVETRQPMACVALTTVGTYWGEQGWARVVRGKNNLGIEITSEWSTPKLA